MSAGHTAVHNTKTLDQGTPGWTSLDEGGNEKGRKPVVSWASGLSWSLPDQALVAGAEGQVWSSGAMKWALQGETEYFEHRLGRTAVHKNMRYRRSATPWSGGYRSRMVCWISGWLKKFRW